MKSIYWFGTRILILMETFNYIKHIHTSTYVCFGSQYKMSFYCCCMCMFTMVAVKNIEKNIVSVNRAGTWELSLENADV